MARFVLPWEPDSAVPCRQRLGGWSRPVSHGHHCSVRVPGKHVPNLQDSAGHLWGKEPQGAAVPGMLSSLGRHDRGVNVGVEAASC